MHGNRERALSRRLHNENTQRSSQRFSLWDVSERTIQNDSSMVGNDGPWTRQNGSGPTTRKNGSSILGNDRSNKTSRFRSMNLLRRQSKLHESESGPDIRASYYHQRRNRRQTPDLIQWFRDTRPILEHVIFFSLHGINGTVVNNLTLKKQKHNMRPLSVMARKSMGVAMSSLVHSRISAAFAFDDDHFRETLQETKQRSTFFDIALNRYYSDNANLNQEAELKDKTGQNLNKQIEALDRMSTNDIFDEDDEHRDSTGEKGEKQVRFRLRSQSLYETVIEASHSNTTKLHEEQQQDTPPALKRPLKSSLRVSVAEPRKLGSTRPSAETNPTSPGKKKMASILRRSQSHHDNNEQDTSKNKKKKESSSSSPSRNTSHNHYGNTQGNNNTSDLNQNADVDDPAIISDNECLCRRVESEIDMILKEMAILQAENTGLKMLRSQIKESSKSHGDVDVSVAKTRIKSKTFLLLFQIFVYFLATTIGTVIGKLLL